MRIETTPTWPVAEALPLVRIELGKLYRDLDRAIAEHRPTCELSGRCCKFKKYDHTLYLSAPEALLLVADAPPPVRPLDDGGTCPWQDERGRCSAREARPLGCRVFYCDPSYAPEAPGITEAFLSRLKRLTEEYGWPWCYAGLHQHLERACAERWLANEALDKTAAS
jgi:Fe-S-cluster containining protein